MPRGGHGPRGPPPPTLETQNRTFSLRHAAPLLFQTPGEAGGLCSGTGGQRKQECPASSCVSLPRNAGEGRGTLLPPLHNGHPARLQGVKAGRKRRGGRGDEGRGRRAMLRYHHVRLGLAVGGLGGTHAVTHTRGGTAVLVGLEQGSSFRANITPLSWRRGEAPRPRGTPA